MPLVACPECGRRQTVRRELTGLQVECESCGAEFRAVEAPPRRSDRRPDGEPDGVQLQPRAIARGLVLIGAVSACLLVVGGLLVWAIRPPDPKGETKPTAKAAVPPPRSEPARAENPAEGNTEEALAEGGRLAIQLAVAGLGLAYLVFIMWAGAWVARDAFARGMPGLGWAAFYYVFQVTGRLIGGVPLSLAIKLIDPRLLPVLVPVALVAGELAGWLGLIVYRYARRPGRLVPCDRCGNRRLEYLGICPLCGLDVQPNSPPTTAGRTA